MSKPVSFNFFNNKNLYDKNIEKCFKKYINSNWQEQILSLGNLVENDDVSALDISNISLSGLFSNQTNALALSESKNSNFEVQNKEKTDVREMELELYALNSDISLLTSSINAKELMIKELQVQLNKAISDKEKAQNDYYEKFKEYNDKVETAKVGAKKAYEEQEVKEGEEPKSYEDFYNTEIGSLTPPTLNISTYDTIITKLKSQINATNAEINASKTILSTNQAGAAELAAALNNKITQAKTVVNIDEVNKTTGVSSADEVSSAAPINQNAASQASTDDGIDWTALKVEGKGVNIYNLLNLFCKDVGAGNSSKRYNSLGRDEYLLPEGKAWLSKDEIEELKANASEDDKKLIELAQSIFSGTSFKSSKNFNDKLMKLARFDTDSDGFLSEEETKIIPEFLELQKEVSEASRAYQNSQLVKTKKKEKNEIEANYEKTKNAMAKFEEAHGIGITMKTYDELVGKPESKSADDTGFQYFSSTTVNGQKLYLVGGHWGNMALTDEQYEIMDKYFANDRSKYVAFNKKGDAVLDIEKEMGATKVKSYFYEIDGPSGLKSSFYNGGITCSCCDEGLYKIYRAIKADREQNKIK